MRDLARKIQTADRAEKPALSRFTTRFALVPPPCRRPGRAAYNGTSQEARDDARTDATAFFG